MLQTVIEQYNILLITVFGGLIYLLREGAKLLYDYYATKLKFKQAQDQQIETVETELAVIELRKQAQREEVLKDKMLEYKLNRNVLLDGIKINHILKELRENLDAQTVSIAIYHNGVAKGFKNFSFRFQEAISIKHSTIYNYQAMPLSSHYEELAKYEKLECLFYNKTSKNLPLLVAGILEQHELEILISYPILIEHIDNDNLPNNVINIERDGKNFALLGSLLVAIDKDCTKTIEEHTTVKYIKEKLSEIMAIYKDNNNIFS
jgi:hypothetical protein